MRTLLFAIPKWKGLLYFSKQTKDMLYVIKPEEQNRASLTEILTAHPEIKFVSFMGVDFAGNDTDEKVPISLFLKDIDGIMEGMAPDRRQLRCAYRHCYFK